MQADQPEGGFLCLHASTIRFIIQFTTYSSSYYKCMVSVVNLFLSSSLITIVKSIESNVRFCEHINLVKRTQIDI